MSHKYSSENNGSDSNGKPSDGNPSDGSQPDRERTKLKVKKVKSGRTGDNRILAGMLMLAVIVVGGFLLTWAFPRSGFQKPVQPTPSVENADVDTAEIITQKVTAVPGVEGAQVIVLSRVALIALEVKPDLSAAEVKRIKNESTSAAKERPEVNEVLVTANPDLGKELQKILQGEAPLERLDYIYERIRDQHL